MGIQGSLSYGEGINGGIGLVSVSGGGYGTITNAPFIENLEGPGRQYGGSIGIPIKKINLVVGSEINVIPQKNNITYYGLTGQCGIGTSSGFECHYMKGITGTWDKSEVNVFDLFDKVYDCIMEW